MTKIRSVLSTVRSAAFVLAAGAAAGLVPAGGAHGQVGAEAAGRQIAEAYDVKVLKVVEGEIDDRPVWLVTVMNADGNYNAAFQVNTLAVDKQTGQLVPSFRHRTSGYDVVPGGRDDKVGIRPDAVRTGTWR